MDFIVTNQVHAHDNSINNNDKNNSNNICDFQNNNTIHINEGNDNNNDSSAIAKTATLDTSMMNMTKANNDDTSATKTSTPHALIMEMKTKTAMMHTGTKPWTCD